MKNPYLILFCANLANFLLEKLHIHKPNFIAATQSMKEELLIKVRPLFENLQLYENALHFFKNIPLFDVESKRCRVLNTYTM